MENRYDFISEEQTYCTKAVRLLFFIDYVNLCIDKRPALCYDVIKLAYANRFDRKVIT